MFDDDEMDYEEPGEIIVQYPRLRPTSQGSFGMMDILDHVVPSSFQGLILAIYGIGGVAFFLIFEASPKLILGIVVPLVAAVILSCLLYIKHRRKRILLTPTPTISVPPPPPLPTLDQVLMEVAAARLPLRLPAGKAHNLLQDILTATREAQFAPGSVEYKIIREELITCLKLFGSVPAEQRRRRSPAMKLLIAQLQTISVRIGEGLLAHRKLLLDELQTQARYLSSAYPENTELSVDAPISLHKLLRVKE